MKKIISIIAAVSMLLSLCAVNVSAATSEHPSINVYSELYDGPEDDDAIDPPSNYHKDGYDVYKVWYTTAGVDTKVDMVTGLQIKFTIDDESKVASKSWLPASKKAPKDANGHYSVGAATTSFSKGYIAWADVENGVDVYDWDTYEGGTEETLPYIETLIYVTEGATVNFTYKVAATDTCKLGVVDLEDPDDDREFTTALQFNVNGKPGTVLTLGPDSSGSSDEITEADDGYALENKYVENKADLTDLQGRAVELKKNYGIAKFTETIDITAKDYFLHVVDDQEVPAEADLPINFAEQGFDFESATVSFFAIVRSATHKVVSMTLKAVAKSE